MSTRFTHFVLAASLAQYFASCKHNQQIDVKKQTQKPEAVSYDSVSADEIASLKIQPLPQNIDSSEIQTALAEGGFTNSIGARLSGQWATNGGVLPQVLSPSVRSELKSNGMIAFLNQFPGLGSTLFSSFTNDQAINDKVSAGLTEKIQAGLSQYGGTNINTRLKINFDHFIRSRIDSKAINIVDQAARWNMMWSINGIWNGSKPIDGVDHGLQLLGILRTLSEWSYMFGLKSDGTVAEFGGLVKRWENGQAVQSKAVAPTDPSFSQQLVTGTYNLSAPANISALDLATKGGERWTSTSAPITLMEQASVWIAGAKAFSRFRADRLQSAAGLFRGNAPILSAKMGTLPLAFLSNMGQMLNGPFISERSQRIFATACPSDQCEPADAKTVARLALALMHWLDATNNLQTSGLDANTLAKVNEGIPKLKKALQLAVRTLSGDLTTSTQESGKQVLKVTLNISGPEAAAASAEVIGTLSRIERSQLNSPLLKERVEALANGHAATYLSSPGSITTGESIVWNARMVKELSRSNSKIDWLPKATSQFKASLGADWTDQ